MKMKTGLAERVNKRMTVIERQMRGDFEFAKSQLPPGERSPKAVMEIVSRIEARRAASDLDRIAKNCEVLAGASAEVQAALGPLLARQYARGRNAALESIGNQLDEIGHRLYGNRWIEYDVQELRKGLQLKYEKGSGGNGKSK